MVRPREANGRVRDAVAVTANPDLRTRWVELRASQR